MRIIIRNNTSIIDTDTSTRVNINSNTNQVLLLKELTNLRVGLTN